MKSQEQSYRLTIAEEQPRSQTQLKETKRIRHVYLEEQNIYGRFIPYLLLRDQLQSQIDSSGNTVLHHMCSYNSPYLKLFLSCLEDGDPLLNRKNKLGHVPLDAAGLYCSKEHVEMLKAKGAVDDGNVDFWAIQGGVPTNWSGKILPHKKQLIHWAAYNDMPQVLAQYARQGVSISQSDNNGYSPIQLTILNKSYSSMKVLADLGEKPRKQLLESCDSQSIRDFWKNIDETQNKKNIKKVCKFLSLILFLVFCLVLDFGAGTITVSFLSVLLILSLLFRKAPVQRFMDNDRKSQFISELLFSRVINRNNHLYYILLHMTLIASGISSLGSINFTCHLQAILAIYLIICTSSYSIHLFAQLYAIMSNLTYDELFNSHKWGHLWEKVKYVPERKLVINEFSNPEDKGKWNNIKYYFGI